MDWGKVNRFFAESARVLARAEGLKGLKECAISEAGGHVVSIDQRRTRPIAESCRPVYRGPRMTEADHQKALDEIDAFYLPNVVRQIYGEPLNGLGKVEGFEKGEQPIRDQVCDEIDRRFHVMPQ